MPQEILPDPGSGYQYRPTPGGLRRLERPPTKRGEDLHTLGRAVLELRARRGLSQEQLGFAAGLHRNYVGAIERGEINPTFRILRKLANGLRIPLSELMEVRERHERERLGPYRPSPIARTDDR
jgi:DNA-binding XRE family transcriptional regulator